MAGSRARLFGALVAVGILGGGFLVATPAFAASVPSYDCVVDTPYAGTSPSFQPLRVCASFDKSSYSSGDIVKLTVSVTNLGAATAPRVSLWQQFGTVSDRWIGQPVGPLIPNAGSQGFDLPTGDTIVSEVDGYAADPASGVVTFSAPVYQFAPNGSGSAFGDQVSISSAVTPVTGNYRGVVFADSNGHGQPDPGEELGGVQVTLSGPYQGINGTAAATYTATTDAQGKFQFTNLPAGQYYVSATGPSGWYVQPAEGGQIMVSASSGARPDLFVASPTPVPLTATMSFDQSSYYGGQTANLTINLTNTGTRTLHGIKAQCDPAGEGGQVTCEGAGWGVLAGPHAPGVTVPAGKTTTLHMSQIVPADGFQDIAGKYVADLLFGPYPGLELDGVPQATASATVLPPVGPTKNFTIRFVDDNPLGGSSNANVELLDPASHDLVEETGTNGSQETVTDLPDGTYDIGFSFWSHGWKLAPGQASTLNSAGISAGQTVDVHVVPAVVPAPPAPPAG